MTDRVTVEVLKEYRGTECYQLRPETKHLHQSTSENNLQ